MRTQIVDGPWESAGWFWKYKGVNPRIEKHVKKKRSTSAFVFDISKVINGINPATNEPNGLSTRMTDFKLCAKVWK